MSLLSACTNDYLAIDPSELQATRIAETETAAVEINLNPTEVTPTSNPSPTPLPHIGAAVIPTLAPPEKIAAPPPANAVVSPSSTIIQPTQTSLPPLLYYTQAGDTIPAIASRFKVSPTDISSAATLSQSGFLDPNQLLMIPGNTQTTMQNTKLIPDSEVVFAPASLDFDISSFVQDANGYLSTYREYLGSEGWLDGGQVVHKVAVENSIDPRILLSILEYRSHWVYGQPGDLLTTDYPLGHVEQNKKGLFAQLSWAVSQLSLSYYGWREGILTGIKFQDGTILPGAPDLNAGTFAVGYLFGQMYNRETWDSTLYGEHSFPKLHEKMFGNPWLRAITIEPLFPATLEQPEMILPFEKGDEWAYTGGPHSAWGPEGARAALDFAPSADASGCGMSPTWVVAVAPGVVIRAGNGVVVLDLDGDGNEQTGWNVLYMHIATQDRVKPGDFLEQGDRIGHASCEGGQSTGTHMHIARKFNGEWILAGGPLPFKLGQWIAHAGETAYVGTLTAEEKTIFSNIYGTAESVIVRN